MLVFLLVACSSTTPVPPAPDPEPEVRSGPPTWIPGFWNAEAKRLEVYERWVRPEDLDALVGEDRHRVVFEPADPLGVRCEPVRVGTRGEAIVGLGEAGTRHALALEPDGWTPPPFGSNCVVLVQDCAPWEALSLRWTEAGLSVDLPDADGDGDAEQLSIRYEVPEAALRWSRGGEGGLLASCSVLVGS